LKHILPIKEEDKMEKFLRTEMLLGKEAVEKLKNQPLCGHITLSRSERSDLAAIAAKLL
jgi:predicted ribonuclease YlaK